MLKKMKSSKKGGVSSLASRLKRKPKQTAKRKVAFVTLAGVGAAIVGRAAKGRDPR